MGHPSLHPTLHDPVKLCSETRIADISKRLRSASPLQIWRSCFSDFQVRSWSDCEVSRMFIHCNIFNQFGRAFHFKAKHFWESTRISRAASPPGCDPVRSPMCGCTPTVLSPVRCGYWDCFRWLSQYVGCHWACTNSKGLDVVNENFLEVVNHGSTLRCQRLGQIQ